MPELNMPSERAFGWPLKQTEATQFELITKPNGQFCVVLNHALLRGVTAEMIHWWFLHFPTMRVLLKDVPDYQGELVPGYYLWHPSDHYDASLSGELGPGGTSRAGAMIHIKEAMQYKTYGWKYKVDAALKIFYCGEDGWAMGKELPLLGKAMVLRIHFKDVYKDGVHHGVHYHYEIVVGIGGQHPVARALNRKITANYTQEFFQAWHLHNTIEVGTFENFLPALFGQRKNTDRLEYELNMNPQLEGESQSAYDPELFNQRVSSYRENANLYSVQAPTQPTFLL